MEEENKKEEVQEEVKEPVVEETPEVKEEVPTPSEPVVEGNPKKSNKMLFIIIGIALLIIGLCVGFIVGNGFTNKDEKEKGNEQENEQKNEPKEESFVEVGIDSEEVKTAMDNFSKIYIEAEHFNKETYEIKDLTQQELVQTIGNSAPRVASYCGQELDKNSSISIEEFNNELKGILDIEITDEYLKENIDKLEGVYDFKIIIEDGKYYIKSNNCDGWGFDQILVNKIVSAEKNDKYLHIYEKRGFYKIGDPIVDEGDEGGFGPNEYVEYYKDPETTLLVETKIGKLIPSINSFVEQKEELDWDKYNTYRYVFELKDGDYYFIRHELVNE